MAIAQSMTAASGPAFRTFAFRGGSSQVISPSLRYSVIACLELGGGGNCDGSSEIL